MGRTELHKLSLGERIKYYREVKGIKQEELSIMADIPLGTLQKYEIDNRHPKQDVIEKISRALNISVYDLVDLKCDSKSDILAIISQPNILNFLCDAILDLRGNIEEDINCHSESIKYHLLRIDELKREKEILDMFSDSLLKE